MQLAGRFTASAGGSVVDPVPVLASVLVSVSVSVLVSVPVSVLVPVTALVSVPVSALVSVPVFALVSVPVSVSVGNCVSGEPAASVEPGASVLSLVSRELPVHPVRVTAVKITVLSNVSTIRFGIGWVPAADNGW